MQPSDDPELLLALARRLTGGQLLVGAPPPHLPLDLPMPDGTRVLGSVIYPTIKDPSDPDFVIRPERIEIHLEVPGTTASLATLYLDMCRNQGWTVPHVPPRLQDAGTFYIPADFHSQAADGRYFYASIGRERDGRCAVYLQFGSRPHDTAEGARWLHGNSLSYLLYPILRLHYVPGGPVRFEGGHDVGHIASIEATTRGDLRVTDLESVVSELCRAAGWVRLSGGSEGPIAWSRWSLPQREGHDGWVLVMEGPEVDYFTIHLRLHGQPQEDDGRRHVLAFADAAEPQDS